ncbi:MAG: glycosyltransferase family 39 protein [Thermodesulfobacteriota bacterium]
MTDPNTRRDHPIIACASLAALTVGCLVPFLDKAFHIDDTLFLWTAEQILREPVDFFGFEVHWELAFRPMSAINKNPPLVSYYIAAVAAIVGWSERALHAAFLIPAVALVLGTYTLARGMTSRPYVAALITLFSPGFFVSASSVMSDIPMVALSVWAAVFWVTGLERDDHGRLCVAGILIGLATLTKYFGITMVPLLLVYTVARLGSAVSRAVYLAIPVLMLLGYERLTVELYRTGLFSDAASHAVTSGPMAGSAFLEKALTGLSFIGGCVAPAACFAPMLLSRPGWIAGLVASGLTAALLHAMASFGTLRLTGADGINFSGLAHSVVFVAVGAYLTALAAREPLTRKDPESWLLCCWVLGTLLFASFVNWTTNARTVLPMIPAAGILLARRLDWVLPATEPRFAWRTYLPLVPAALVALTVGWADYTLADCQRSAVRRLQTHFTASDHGVWFEGHWGFQYYMQRVGFRPLDFRKTDLNPGDTVIIPTNNSYPVPLPFDAARLTRTVRVRPLGWLSTMQAPLGAGFYSDDLGPLPYAFGTVGPEEYLVCTITRPLAAGEVLARIHRNSVSPRAPKNR